MNEKQGIDDRWSNPPEVQTGREAEICSSNGRIGKLRGNSDEKRLVDTSNLHLLVCPAIPK